jgi:dinuclear metal center YbgI/SA1388 family protein
LVSDVVRAVEALAPPRLAEEWDRVGLQVGHPAAPVRRAMTCLELTAPTLAEAVRDRANAVVAHHPLLFKPMTALNLAQPAGELVAGLVKAGIALVAAHTNLDAAAWGTNQALSAALGLEPEGPLLPREGEPQFKFVVFVPRGHERTIIDAIDRGGGGRIGAYARCSFRTPGTGSFQGDGTTHPAMGEAGRFEEAEEYRLEAVVPESARAAVVREARAAHPYEEMAYDLYPLASIDRPVGLGLVAQAPEPMSSDELAARIEQTIRPAMVRLSGPVKKKVRRVAICTGSGGSFIGKAAACADAYVTGEIDYHHGVEAHARGLAVIEIGHFESEVFVAAPLAERLARAEKLAAAGVEVFPAKNDLQPFRYL